MKFFIKMIVLVPLFIAAELISPSFTSGWIAGCIGMGICEIINRCGE